MDEITKYTFPSPTNSVKPNSASLTKYKFFTLKRMKPQSLSHTCFYV